MLIKIIFWKELLSYHHLCKHEKRGSKLENAQKFYIANCQQTNKTDTNKNHCNSKYVYLQSLNRT